jgi:hypothetical protein
LIDREEDKRKAFRPHGAAENAILSQDGHEK